MHTWFGNEDVDGARNWRKLVDWCVDGIMTSHPVQLERTLKTHGGPKACAPG